MEKLKIQVDEISWRVGWCRWSIKACYTCNTIFAYKGISTIPKCVKCNDLIQKDFKDDPMLDKLMGVCQT